ncbi:MAG: hypothetical protein GYA36_22160 [Veillonellaceae bacterium]|nr:hypothetical protein [Veillonellaceae bacterium]
MNNLRKSFLYLLVLMITAACSQLSNKSQNPISASPEFQKTIEQTATKIFEPTSSVVASKDSPSTDISKYIPPCASPTDTELLFILDDPSLPFGVCFLYPDDFTIPRGEIPDTWYFTGTPYGCGEMVAATVEMHIESANGKMLEQYANDVVAKAAPGVKAGLDLIYLMPDDTPAMKTEGLPGLVSSRTLFLVHNNTAFIFTFMPLDPGFEDAWLDMERVYSSITSTWTFTR